MTDLSQCIAIEQGQAAHNIFLVTMAGYDDWLKEQPERRRSLLAAQNFSAKARQFAILPEEKADQWSVVAGVADIDALTPWCLAKLAEDLPAGTYRLSDDVKAGAAILGWCLAQHSFDRYQSTSEKKEARILLSSQWPEAEALAIEAQATALVRDLVNTPAEDMGPEALEGQAQTLAEEYGAELEVVRGDALEQGYPLIHAVGRAASRHHAPRLIELYWGNEDHPRLAIIGKGVCFDSGGLDVKSATGMRLMKKDMGGAAHALALASLVMRNKLPVRLHMLIPAVENAIAGNSFRPGDIIKSRKGDTVEIGNTDAEGRLVLADAFTKADESEPDLMIDFATLTGAARIALGPDLPAMFCSDDKIGRNFADLSQEVHDPVWHMPLWQPYEEMLKSPIADTNNIGGAFAGSVTAALFLKRFAPTDADWFHFDTFAWRPTPRPGQAAGGEALGLRASWHYIKARFG
jgi:leucyl aminopeptidase